jgi:potassium-transporting ATPase KdpC subunit
MSISSQIRPALTMLVLFTIVTGVLYPLAVTGIAQIAFPAQANGSVIIINDVLIGSQLVGQPFDDPSYFWTRPSSTGPFPYNAAASSGSNLAPTSDDLLSQVLARIDMLRASDPNHTAPIPVGLVTASGSGLDPHISPAAAEYQVGRVARARGLDKTQVHALVAQYTQSRQLGFLGEPRVNVRELNLAFDTLAASGS